MDTESELFKQIGLRLEKIRKTLDYSRADFSKLLGLTEAYYGQMARGTRKTTVVALYNLLKEESGFNLDWIVAGKGEMVKNDMSNDLDREIIKLTAERDLLMKILEQNKREG